MLDPADGKMAKDDVKAVYDVCLFFPLSVCPFSLKTTMLGLGFFVLEDCGTESAEEESWGEEWKTGLTGQGRCMKSIE